jgi:hypothetical protein
MLGLFASTGQNVSSGKKAPFRGVIGHEVIGQKGSRRDADLRRRHEPQRGACSSWGSSCS